MLQVPEQKYNTQTPRAGEAPGHAVPMPGSARPSTAAMLTGRSAILPTPGGSARLGDALAALALDEEPGVQYWPTMSLARTATGYAEPIIEEEYVVYRQSSITRFLVMNCVMIVAIPTFHLALTYLPYGWAFFTALTMLAIDITIVIAAIINSRCTTEARKRARIQEILCIISLVANVGSQYVNTFEVENLCYVSARLSNPTRPLIEGAQDCLNISPSDLIVLFSWCITLGTRFTRVVPVMIGLYAITFLSLLVVTDAPLDSRTQIVARAVIYACVYTCVACVAWFQERAKRDEFAAYVKLLRATYETRQTSDRIDSLLAAMLPMSVLKRMTLGTEVICDCVESASVSFSDVVSFTNWSSSRTAQQVVEMVSALVLKFDAAAHLIGVEKVKTIGDAYWAMAGLPDRCVDHESKICEFTLSQMELCAIANVRHPEWNGIRLRIGAHTGEVVGGVIGKRQLSYEVFGHTNEIAEELEQFAPNGSVLVSETTKAGVEQGTNDGTFIFEKYKPITIEGGHLLDTYLIYRREHSRSSKQTLTTRRSGAATFDRDQLMKNLGVPGHDNVSDSTDTDMEWLKLTEADTLTAGGPACRCCTSLFLTFPSEDLTRQFVDFDWAEKATLRRLVAITHLVVLAGMTIGLMIEAADFLQIIIGLAVYVLCIVACIILSIVTFRMEFGKTSYRVYFGMLWLIQVGILTGSALLPRGHLASNSWTSVLFFPLTAALVTPGSIHRVFIAGSVIGLSIFAFFTNTQLLMEENAFWFVICSVVPIVISIMEGSQDKQAFVLSRTSEEAFLEATEEEDLQREILQMVAPAHIVPSMLNLIQLPASKRMIAHEIPLSTVCFCKVLLRDHHHDSKDMWEDISSKQARVEAVLNRYPLLTKIKTVGGILIVAGPLQLTSTREDAAACAKQMLEFALDVVHPERLVGVELPAEEPNENDDNNDEVALVPDAESNKEGLAEKPAAKKTIVEHLEPLAKQCGLHSGPLNAAVFGTERMAYDTFGDTMNTSSRYMSTAKPHTVQVSGASKLLISEVTGGEGLFEQAVQTSVAMKGKGDVAVFVL